MVSQLQLLAQVVVVIQQLGWFPAENRQPCRGTLLPGMAVPLFQKRGTSPTVSCTCQQPSCARPEEGAAAGQGTGTLSGTSLGGAPGSP